MSYKHKKRLSIHTNKKSLGHDLGGGWWPKESLLQFGVLNLLALNNWSE